MKTAQRVREYMKGRGLISTGDLRKALLLGWKPLHSALGAMLKRGEIRRQKKGWYEYVGAGEHIKTTRIHKAMHIRGTFSPREVRVLAEASKDLIWKAIWRLVEAGDLEIVGKRDAPNARKENVYRVRHRDNFYRQYVLSAPGGSGPICTETESLAGDEAGVK